MTQENWTTGLPCSPHAPFIDKIGAAPHPRFLLSLPLQRARERRLEDETLPPSPQLTSQREETALLSEKEGGIIRTPYSSTQWVELIKGRALTPGAS